VFIDLIDAAFEAHRQWQRLKSAYHSWALGFKIQVLSQLATQSRYAAGLLLRYAIKPSGGIS